MFGGIYIFCDVELQKEMSYLYFISFLVAVQRFIQDDHWSEPMDGCLINTGKRNNFRMTF